MVATSGVKFKECCSGLKSLLFIAKTTPDHQSFCSCIKGVASSGTPNDLSRAASLPGLCHARRNGHAGPVAAGANCLGNMGWARPGNGSEVDRKITKRDVENATG
ncbi:hypothetical protein RND71_005921 [Anisodus tanguticus]|uniref:Bifunctional inhibitor/plant lipid transfer protein/seed storage helical domain-containing protein n=1 Tax=Anisodus tanguticus TaxID=243964 RepID=A0AAE1SST7_9SOLA|nr:hypothetical protein RND71_005921 [Anisodus tanguticus]